MYGCMGACMSITVASQRLKLVPAVCEEYP